ncbi:MAG: PaaI family thioesterase [Cellvibrionales bacterium]|nr:PaaI family thioesterase [Cellvibrionales bacterium]
MANSFKTALEGKDKNALIQAIPYAKMIGMQTFENTASDYLLRPLESNLGNPTLPALHGGCIGGFMENAAIVEAIFTLELAAIPRIIDFSLDYLRPGRLQETYARCHIVRQGKKVVNVAITAWQTDIESPIAKARAHLLL